MKKFKKLLSVFMALLLLLLACACSSDDPDAETSGGDGTVATTEAETLHPDDLPEDLNFNGAEITFACRGGNRWTQELMKTEDGSTILNEAVYARNSEVENRLGVVLTTIPGDTSQDMYMQDIAIQIRSGASEYDIIAGAQYLAVQGVLEDLYLDLSDNQYLDFSKKYWNDNYMSIISMGSAKRYCLAGDMALSMLGWTTCTYFNKNLYNDAMSDENASNKLYEQVLAGDWTFEDFSVKVKQCYKEDDVSPVYGLYAGTNSCTDRYTLSAGMKFSTISGTGDVLITMYNDTMLRFVDDMKKLYFNNEGTKVYDVDIVYEPFMEGESVFVVGTLNAAVYYFSNMQDDYGIIPFPKYEKEMEYCASVQDNVALYMIPTSVDSERVDMLGAVLECMASESSRSVLPVFYESALKIRYAKDELTGQMVDIIHDNAYTDFIYVYSNSLSKIGTIMRAIMSDTTVEFSSLYRERYDNASILIKDISAFYLK